ncbi:MAG: TonB-dependent receptor [Bradyrhizobium sp.]|nr:TonB-dependent receptor [Bradyrhizobium sp.]
MTFRKSILRATTACAVAVCATGHAQAQVALPAAAPAAPKAEAQDPAAATAIPDIVVTAQKYEQRLQDVPISISAYSAADIRSKSTDGLKDLAQFTPNLTFSNHGTSGNSGAIVYIRGIGQQDSGIEFDPGVGIYVDGIYMGRSQGVDLDLVDIARVEVLRGPQGTLFGKNTVGGAINVITAKPEDKWAGSADLTVGAYHRMDAKAGINIPIVPGRLALKIVGATRNRDGYATLLDYATGQKRGEQGNINRISGQAQLLWTPTDTLDVLLSVDGLRAREESNPHKLAAVAQPALIVKLNSVVDPDFGPSFLTSSPFTSYATGGNVSNLDTSGVSLIITQKLGGWTAKSLTSLRRVETLYISDPDGSPYEILHSNQLTKQHQFSQELLLTGSVLGDRLKPVLGLFYFSESAYSNRRTSQLADLYTFFGQDLLTTTEQWNRAESYSAFAHGTFAITPRLSITGGIRYTEDKKTGAGQIFRPRAGVFSSPYQSLETNWGAFSGRIGLEYRWSDALMTYASASRGYKSGGINSAASSAATLRRFDPELVWTYEAGFKSDLFDRHVRLNAAAFYSDYNDIQFRVRLSDPLLGAITYIDNASKARIQGFEAELTVLPVKGLTLNGGVGYTDARYTAVKVGSPVSINSRFVETPAWTATAAAEYVAPLSDAADLRTSIDYAYRSRTYHDIANTPSVTQAPYGLVNARIAYENRVGNWSLALFGTNLTDKHYIIGGIDFTSSLGWADVQYARPREWGVEFRKSF